MRRQNGQMMEAQMGLTERVLMLEGKPVIVLIMLASPVVMGVVVFTQLDLEWDMNGTILIVAILACLVSMFATLLHYASVECVPRRFRLLNSTLICERASLLNPRDFRVFESHRLDTISAIRPETTKVLSTRGTRTHHATNLFLNNGRKVTLCEVIKDDEGKEIAQTLTTWLHEARRGAAPSLPW